MHNDINKCESLFEKIAKDESIFNELNKFCVLVDTLVNQGHILFAICVSLLGVYTSIQIRCEERWINMLIDASWFDIESKYEKNYDLLREQDTHCFPINDHARARNKVVVSVTDVVSALQEEDKILLKWINSKSSALAEMYNHQVVALILYCVAKQHILGRETAFKLAVSAIKNTKVVEVLNEVVKSLGMNALRVGSAVCKLKNLKSRGVGEVDLFEEAKKRCIYEGNGSTCQFDSMKLRSAIKVIL